MRALDLGLYAAAALVTLSVAACGHVTNEGHSLNEPLCNGQTASCGYDPKAGYRFNPDRASESDPAPDKRDTLVVLTMSGGGVRAAALAYGTLLALQKLPGSRPGSASLLDEVDIVSSVSGGSVTAGWYALNGQEGLRGSTDDNQLRKFLYDHAMGDLAWRGLNPAAALGYLVTNYQRSDVLADYFASSLFGQKTYADVLTRYNDRKQHQPFVILNATDVGHETGFPFTQNRFDLLCSDLSKYRLADAVAASANFPIVFSAAGLKNYSRECSRLHAAPEWQENGPARWMRYYNRCFDASDVASASLASAVRSNQLFQLRAARMAKDYVEAREDDTFIHLLDGGLVDNLGILSTLALEDMDPRVPGLYQRLHFRTEFAKRYSKIKRVLYIVVNARARSPAAIDDTVAPPDLLSTVKRVIDTPIDAGILGMQSFLTAELQAAAAEETQVDPAQTRCPPAPSNDETVTIAGPSAAAPNPKLFSAHIVSIDFEMIPVRRCRDRFWALGTSWTLADDDITRLVEMPKILLRRSPELEGFYADYAKKDSSENPLRAYFKKEQSKRDGFTTAFDGVCS